MEIDALMAEATASLYTMELLLGLKSLCKSR